MYGKGRGQLLEEYGELVEKSDDYGLTAYATWRVSYTQLKPLAKQLYDLLAFMHHNEITEDIFRYATIGLGKHAWIIPPTDDESTIQEMTTSVLANFTRLADGSWDKAAFMRAIDDLQSYSLLAYDRFNRTYSIHPLVHEWTRTMIDDGLTICSCTSLLLASSIIWKDKTEDIAYRRTLLYHIDILPTTEKMRPRLAERFALVYREAGRYKETEILAKAVCEASTKLHGRADLKTLGSMNDLAIAYSMQGRYKKAEALLREVLELSKRAGHIDLTCMNNLAATYANQRRWEEAETLQQEILELRKRWQGSKDPETLYSMGNLAYTYSSQGRWEEAETLQQEVLESTKRVQGGEHPDTLLSMSNLALTYWRQGRWLEAEVLQWEVLELSKRVQGCKHPDTLQRMTKLALTYQSQGRLQESIALWQEIFELRKPAQSSEPFDTLKILDQIMELLD